MKHLFVYGSLMFDEVWQRLITHRYRRIPASLEGYQRRGIRNQVYPAMLRSCRSHVDGLLIMNVKDRDIRRLDRFEGQYYKRSPVTVSVGKHLKYRAQTYLLKPRFRKLLSRQEWNAAQFAGQHLQLFLSRYKNFNR